MVRHVLKCKWKKAFIKTVPFAFEVKCQGHLVTHLWGSQGEDYKLCGSSFLLFNWMLRQQSWQILEFKPTFFCSKKVFCYIYLFCLYSCQTVEKFFSKDIRYLVSSKPEARHVHRLARESPVPSPESVLSSPRPSSSKEGHRSSSQGPTDPVSERG